jgi:hypothetical protein
MLNFRWEKTQGKITKYDKAIAQLKNKKWNVVPLLVIKAGSKRTIHKPSTNLLKNIFKIP